MVVVLVEGIIMLENVVKEFEIVDLVNYINGMGGKICGVGIGIIKIEGVEKFYGVKYYIIFDCIEVGIFMVVVVIIEGNVLVKGVVFEYFIFLIVKMEEMGVMIKDEGEGLCVIGLKEFKLIDIKIMFYLGFLIDMQL